jgi:hypothetical protein
VEGLSSFARLDGRGRPSLHGRWLGLGGCPYMWLVRCHQKSKI